MVGLLQSLAHRTVLQSGPLAEATHAVGLQQVEGTQSSSEEQASVPTTTVVEPPGAGVVDVPVGAVSTGAGVVVAGGVVPAGASEVVEVEPGGASAEGAGLQAAPSAAIARVESRQKSVRRMPLSLWPGLAEKATGSRDWFARAGRAVLALVGPL